MRRGGHVPVEALVPHWPPAAAVLKEANGEILKCNDAADMKDVRPGMMME